MPVLGVMPVLGAMPVLAAMLEGKLSLLGRYFDVLATTVCTTLQL